MKGMQTWVGWALFGIGAASFVFAGLRFLALQRGQLISYRHRSPLVPRWLLALCALSIVTYTAGAALVANADTVWWWLFHLVLFVFFPVWSAVWAHNFRVLERLDAPKDS